MPRAYSAVFSAVAVSAAQDFFELNAPSDAIVIVHGVVLSQSTEIGDAMEEELSILVKRGAATSGSGGTSVTPTPLEASDAAFGGTVEANNTTKASTGTIVTLHSDGWNVRSQYLWIPTPEIRWTLPPSGRLTVELVAAPADPITMNGTLYFTEVG